MSRQHDRPEHVEVLFGEVTWTFPHAYLSLGINSGSASAEPIFSARPPTNVRNRRDRTEAFPRNQRELCIATAWKLAQDGHTVRICCSNEESVAAFASAIVHAYRDGALPPLPLPDADAMRALLRQGEEWLGPNSATLKCLRLGLVLDDGSFPAHYWDEVQRLLQVKILKIVITPEIRGRSAISVSALVFHSMWRRGTRPSQASFNGIVRRHVKTCNREDLLVLFPLFSSIKNKRELHRIYSRNYAAADTKGELLPLALSLLCRARRLVRGNLFRLATYFEEEATAWTCPEIPNERLSKRSRARADWDLCLTVLDKAISDTEDVIGDPAEAVSEVVAIVIRKSGTALPADICSIIRSLFIARARFIRSSCSQNLACDSDTRERIHSMKLYEQVPADDRNGSRCMQLAS